MKIRGFLILIAAGMIATSPFAQLTASDVTQIVHHALARAVAISPNSVIAVTDREATSSAFGWYAVATRTFPKSRPPFRRPAVPRI